MAGSKSKLLPSLIVGSGFVLTQLSMLLYLPAMPHLTSVFRVSNEKIKLTLSIALVGYALGQLLWGTISDHFGRRRIILIALILYLLAAVNAAFSHSYLEFGIALFILGFTAATFTSIGNAIMYDIYGHQKAALAIAYVGVAMAISPTIAPALGSHLLVGLGWRSIYFFLVCYAAVLFVGMLFFVPETRSPEHKPEKNILKLYLHMLKNSRYLAFLIALGVMFGCLFAYFNTAAFIYIKFLNVSVTTFGWLMLVSSFSYIVGTVLVSQFIQKIGPHKIVLTGIIIALFGSIILLGLSLLHVRNIPLILVSLIILILGLGLVIPASKAGAMTTFTSHSGSAASLMKFTQIVIAVLFTLIAAELPSSTSMIPLAILITFGALLALMLFYMLGFQRNTTRGS